MRNITALKRKRRATYAKRRNKKVKAVFLTGFAFVFLALFFAIKSVLIPAVSAFGSRSNSLKSKDIYSILLVNRDDSDLVNSAKVLIVQKKDRKLYSIVINPKSRFDLPGRFGTENLQTILKLAASVGKRAYGPDLLVETVKDHLKLSIDKYIILGSGEFEKLETGLYKKDLSMFFPWEINHIIKAGDTNLTSGDLLDLLMFTRGLKDRSFETVNLDQVADWSLRIRDITLNADVSKESLGIVILNGTGRPNVAKQSAQAMQNVGARVSLTDNAENEYEKSYLITDDPTSATARYIKSYYPNINIISRSKASSLGEALMDRGDICLILGFDILGGME